MVSRRENLKRYIKLVTSQLPKYFSTYSEEDQKFLEKFVTPLRFSEEADYNRKELAQRFRDARNYFIDNELYLKYPFFWFVDSYFENAEVSLKTSTFHADSFYDYLLPILRGTAGQDDGVFQLLRKSVPLSDFKWEEIQYRSAKLHIPLQPYELEIIKTVYNQLRAQPLQLLKPRRIRSILLSQHDIPRLSSKLSRLFSMLNTKWTVWPHYSAFGIQSIFFHLQLNPQNVLRDIIDFQDKINGIMTTSNIYTIRGVKHEYMGIMHIPENTHKQLTHFLEKKMLKGQVLKFTLTPIIENRWTYSLAQYQTDSGWQELNKSSWMGRVRLMNLKTLPRRRKKIELEYITPVKAQNWTYQNLTDPVEAIKLICKRNIFDYSDLITEIYTSDEQKLLKLLIKEHTLFVGYFPYRLGAEYSLDAYLVEAPNISFYQLKRLLELLPSARIARSANSNYIYTYLTSSMATQIRNDLEWPLYPLLPTHTAAKRNREMFNTESLTWYQPNILAD